MPVIKKDHKTTAGDGVTMEKGIFAGLAVVLLAFAASILFLLVRGPPLYRRAQQEKLSRNEKVASRLMTLTLILGALAALMIAAWSVL